MRTLCVVLSLCSSLAAAAEVPPPGEVPERLRTAPDDKPKLVINDLDAQGVDPNEAAAVTDAIVAAMTERALFRVLSAKDISAVVSAERTRQLLGTCTGEGNDAGCAADLGEAMGAAFVMTGALSKIGTAYQLSLQTLDTVKGKLLGRSLRLSGDLKTLLLVVPYAAAEASGTPLPPPRSRLLQYSMMAGGSALVVGGGFLGMLAISREAVLNQQLCPPDGAPDGSGTCAGTGLLPLESYRAENTLLGTQKTAALLMLGAGAALIAGGIFLLPPPEQGGSRVALVPSSNGAVLVGVFE